MSITSSYQSTWESSGSRSVKKISKQSRLWLGKDTIVLQSPYQAEFVKDMRELPGRQWMAYEKVNTFPMTSLRLVKDLADKWEIFFPAELQALLATAPEPVIPEPQLGLEVEGEKVILRFPFSRLVVDDIKKNVPASKWDSKKRYWATTIGNLEPAYRFAERNDLVIQRSIVEQIAQERSRAIAMREASFAIDSDIDVPSALPLLPYQKAGVAYGLATRRCMIADSMGLGKTLEALSICVMEKAFPAVVVCPNTLKLNWEAECNLFFPDLTVTVVSGGKKGPIEPADLIVVNYDVVSQRADDVIDLEPVALICDESHAIKNGKAKYFCPACGIKCQVNSVNCPDGCGIERIEEPEERWTVKRAQGVMNISRSLPEDSIKLMLSGTPITSRPAELVPQLIAIDRIDEFGGRWGFMSRYAPQGIGATNLVELNEKLRATCFIRRTQKDVFKDLPELRTARQRMPVSNKAMKEYQVIENDVVHFLADRARTLAEEAGEDGTRAYVEKAIRAEAAEHLVKISVLKNAVADLKYASIISWIESFLEDSDEKLVVFGEHIEMVEKIVAHFPDISVKIRGGVSNEDRKAAVDKFQTDPGCRLFVGNMAAASEGLTLTAASNVVFTELGWTPSIHLQCASRCYARANDMHGATAWYLLAPNTIDDEIFALLQKKEKVVNAATDGVEVEKQTSILADLVVSLAQRGYNQRDAA